MSVLGLSIHGGRDHHKVFKEKRKMLYDENVKCELDDFTPHQMSIWSNQDAKSDDTISQHRISGLKTEPDDTITQPQMSGLKTTR